MELKKVWFPLVLAAAWVLITAVTLSGFAGFSGATRAAAKSELAQRRHAHSQVEVRRSPAVAEHI